jgi:hypothetical protein
MRGRKDEKERVKKGKRRKGEKAKRGKKNVDTFHLT